MAMSAENAYLTDRKYEGMRATGFTRVFIGRAPSNRCSGSTLEQCQSALAIRENLKCQERAAGVWQCLGRKKLYRGTGMDNRALGLESLDLRVIDGRITGESVVVQIVETLQLGAQPDQAERRCEDFGANGFGSCAGVEPITPLPPAPTTGPKFSRPYSRDELAGIAGTVQMMQYCMQSMPDLRAAGEPIYQRWRNPRADVAGFMETELATDIAAAIARSAPVTVDSQDHELCGGTFAAIDMQTRPANPLFKTPESTWTAFKAALARGDGNAAAACYSNPYGRFGAMFPPLSAQQLADLGKSLVRFDMLAGGMKDYERAIVERADGISAEVLFVKMGEEWRIEQM